MTIFFCPTTRSLAETFLGELFPASEIAEMGNNHPCTEADTRL